MLGVQQRALIVLKVDIDNILMSAQNNDIGNATQHQ